MPPPPTASVQYKKKDGTLTLSQDSRYLFFSPPNSSPTATIPVADVTNLQQTPESSAKVALKIVVKDENYVFSFISKTNARKEQEAVTDKLRDAIAANKASSARDLVAATTSTPVGPSTAQQQQNGGQSAAMAIAKATSSKVAADEGWYDDNKLKEDINLKRSLLESNPPLQSRFNQALSDRPESVSISQFTNQFWSTRLHLLRAHAIEKAQRQGEYNVLPEIKFTRKAAEKEGEPDTKTLQITKEQIHLIFKQYPVVKEAYNENVPKPLDAGQFWTRFFGSRLLKKLKGEKITQVDPPDGVLDKYLERREERGGNINDTHVPHFIDLEGNEQNHSQRKGNQPDLDMRPGSHDKVPILRTLNNLSEKMLSHVRPEDTGEAHGPIGMDESAFEELRLRDLALGDEDNRVRLNVREMRGMGGGDGGEEGVGDELSRDAKLYAQQDPDEVLERLGQDLKAEKLGADKNGTLKLDQAIGYHSDFESNDSEDEEEEDNNDAAMTDQTNGAASSRRKPQVGSHTALNSASSTILSSIKTRRLASSTDPTSLQGLSQQTYDQLTITHNTTTEFLHYFWTLFLSGDSTRTSELAQLVSTLDRSLDRIHAVAQTAEEEREKVVAEKKEKERLAQREYERRTGKRRKLDSLSAEVEGGKAAVDAMIQPTVRAVGVAGEAYRRALEEQSRETATAS